MLQPLFFLEVTDSKHCSHTKFLGRTNFSSGIPSELRFDQEHPRMEGESMTFRVPTGQKIRGKINDVFFVVKH